MSDDFLEELKRDFINEALFMMEQYEESMLALESASEAQEHIARIFRVAHSIKGGAAAVGFEDLSQFAHKAEDLLSLLRVAPENINTEIISLFLDVGDQFKLRLEQLKAGNSKADWNAEELAQKLLSWIEKFQEGNFTVMKNDDLLTQVQVDNDLPTEPLFPIVETEKQNAKKLQTESSILKVDSLRVDSMLDVVGEIVVLKNQLMHSETVQNRSDTRLNFIVDQLDKSIRDLYEKTLGIRMTPLKSLFMKLQRTVRDVSVKLQKPVDLQLIGEETEVDRSVFELLGDPLMHMARNAMDHGIENSDDRKKVGKPAIAKLTIAAKQVGGSVQIKISEDGRGIDRNKVLSKALEKKLITSFEEGQKLEDSEVFQFLFAAGFSTADVVTDLSGRGVGLDVVRSNIEKIKGSISIESQFGVGTTFTISIPLTTSITDGIVVAICGQRYMVPIHSIREIVQFRRNDVTEVAQLGLALRIRNKMTPIVNLERALESTKFSQNFDESKKNKQNTYIVIESSVGLSALQVDDVLGQSQVVAKPLVLGQSVNEFSGAATLGDGQTILIIEPNHLVQSGLRISKDVV